MIANKEKVKFHLVQKTEFKPFSLEDLFLKIFQLPDILTFKTQSKMSLEEIRTLSLPF